MGGTDSGRPQRRRVDEAAKAGFVAALRNGTARDEAAAAQGFTAEAFYYLRKRDAVFRLAWIWAIDLSARDQREAQRAASLAREAEGDPIESNNRRMLQRRRARGIRFTDSRKQVYLDHFAGTADLQASADAAGVHMSTVYKHLRIDPVFAEGNEDALRRAYALLEAEAVRQRLEALRRAPFEPQPIGEGAKEFERVIQLLARLERRDGRIGMRQRGQGALKRWTFEESMALLDKKLRALGARRLPPPSEPVE